MKYRDPETGGVFETIEKARKEYCEGKKFCSECQFSCLLFAERHPAEAARLMGHEVIDDVSYDSSGTCGICENSTPFGICGMVKCTKTDRYFPCEHKCDLKEDNMDKQDKPLSEWTLGEVQALCERRNGDGCCDECPFANVIGNCTLRVLPEEWELEEVRRLTEPEIAIMRAVGAKWVSRDKHGDSKVNFVRLWDEKPKKFENVNGWIFEPSAGDHALAVVYTSLFPSVHPGDCIELEDAQ